LIREEVLEGYIDDILDADVEDILWVIIIIIIIIIIIH